MLNGLFDNQLSGCYNTKMRYLHLRQYFVLFGSPYVRFLLLRFFAKTEKLLSILNFQSNEREKEKATTISKLQLPNNQNRHTRKYRYTKEKFPSFYVKRKCRNKNEHKEKDGGGSENEKDRKETVHRKT